MVFIDTWAWLALALRRDQHHDAAKKQHAEFVKAGRIYVTTDYVLSELITQLYRFLPASESQTFVAALLAAIDAAQIRLQRVTPEQFEAAWQLRQRYDDKPTISFVDFTSFVVMRDLAIVDVFTGDKHFSQVNLGFSLLP